MTQPVLGRRGFLGATVASASLLAGSQAARAAESTDATYIYPISRSDDEWRERLSDIEHFVLRKGGTEAPHTSTLWNNTVGTYCCRGCDLTVYDSVQKLELDKGWVFFRHSRKDTVMTDLDLGQGMADDPFARMQAMMEVHCRRCGSHLGHIVALPEVPGRPIHCINGFALEFVPQTA